MTQIGFSLELAQQLYKSSEQFPIDFEDAQEWLGFSTKGNAKRSFLKAGFIEGLDFRVFIINDKNSLGGRPVEGIKLSAECLKLWGMMAGTEKGHQVRLYFLECERIAKSLTGQPIIPALPQPTSEERLAMATNALGKLGIDLDNPRHAQGLRDWAFNLLGIAGSQPVLSGERWMGAAERAEELGFGRIGADHSIRVKLGRWVGKDDLIRRREKRYCNGEDREIWCYLVCDEFDESIRNFFEDFFNRKQEAS